MADVKTTCRDLAELTTAAQLACRLLFQECYKAGIKDIFITETYRSQERQNYLWSLGRSILYNEKGEKVAKVTWTLDSNHKSRRAWDIATAPPKSLYDTATLRRVGAIAAKLGITWGGQASWVAAGKTDQPHFEIPTSWKAPAGYKLEGTVIVPSNSNMKVQLIVKDKEPIREDDDIMIFSSTTAKEAVRDHVDQMTKSGHIQKEWLEKFDKGTMTNGDYEGIKLIHAQRVAAASKK